MLTALGGLALLLLGIDRISGALEAWAGGALRRLLARAVDGRLQGLFAGTVVAAATQSGTATAVTTLGFVASGLASVASGLAMSLGAKVGATLAIQVAAFALAGVALPAVGLGFVVRLVPRLRAAGDAVLGLGLLFLGLDLVVGAAAGLGEGEVAALLLRVGAEHPWAVALLGAALGALTSSTNAVTALALGVFASGAMPLPTAVALVVGGNVGGTILPWFAARGLDVPARRVAVGHTLLKAAGAAALVAALEPATAWIPDAWRDAPRTLANVHTAFNLAVALLALPLLGPVARGLARVLPEADDATRPKYLRPDAVDDPALASGMVQREVVRVSDQVDRMLQDAAAGLRTGDWSPETVAALEAKVDRLTHAVVDYLARTRRAHGEDAASEAWLLMVTELEHVGDQIRRMARREDRLRAQGLAFSRVGRTELADTLDRVEARARAAFTALATRDRALARQVVEGRPALEAHVAAMRVAHLGRLEESLATSRASSSHHLEMLSTIRQIDASVTRIAGWVADAPDAPRTPRPGARPDGKAGGGGPTPFLEEIGSSPDGRD